MLDDVDWTLVYSIVRSVPDPVFIALQRGSGARETSEGVTSQLKHLLERKVTFLTCLMAVTVMTKKRGRPLVIGLVGVSMISYRERW